MTITVGFWSMISVEFYLEAWLSFHNYYLQIWWSTTISSFQFYFDKVLHLPALCNFRIPPSVVSFQPFTFFQVSANGVGIRMILIKIFTAKIYKIDQDLFKQLFSRNFWHGNKSLELHRTQLFIVNSKITKMYRIIYEREA